MIEALANAFRIPDLRRKILFTLAMIGLYRVGAHVPVPGVTSQMLETLASNMNASGALGLLNLFAGGALEQFAVFSLGIMPYITSSIIMQLLQAVIPQLEKWQKEGEAGQRKITQITRYVTLGLGLLESIGLVALFQSPPPNGLGVQFDFVTKVLIVTSLLAGTAFIMWMGELITQRGIGNGMSLLIFANIVARFPADSGTGLPVAGRPRRPDPAGRGRHSGRDRLHGARPATHPRPIREAYRGPASIRRLRNLHPAQDQRCERHPDHLRVVRALLPGRRRAALGRGLDDQSRGGCRVSARSTGCSPRIMIVFFAYFYTALVFNPIDLADNLRKQGGFVPGVRPGKATSTYIENVLNRITFPGALFLAAIAVVPTILFEQTKNPMIQAFGGTSILIMVGVALETMTQLESQLKMRNYDGFFK